MNVLVTGGSTRVMIDKVRCISNIFKGRTACNISKYAVGLGHSVTLLGNPEMEDESNLDINFVPYRTYEELYGLMRGMISGNDYDVIIHSSAVSDYEVEKVLWMDYEEGFFEEDNGGKVSSGMEDMYLKLKPTEKIVDKIRGWGFDGKLVKFKLQVDMSDEELLNIAKKSRVTSNADFIVANCLEWSRDRAYIIGRNDKEVAVDRDKMPEFLFNMLEE